MASRLSSDERRTQVARKALELLAEVSPERLTTRSVARAAGVSQPALFRHFASREAILEAAIEFAGEELQAAVAAALPEGAPPRAAIHSLVETLFAFAAKWPGLPRLFFYRAAEAEASFQGPLELLVQRQERLVVEWLRASELPAQLDAERAAELLIATLQGELLRKRLHPRDPEGASAASDEAARVTSLVGHWWAGLEAGRPARLQRGAEAPTPPTPSPGAQLVVLDTRPLLDAGTDPFEEVMATLANIGARGTLLLAVPFRPAPLISVLTARGFQTELLQEAGLVLLLVRGSEAPPFHDLIDLEAPEPMEFVLVHSTALQPGEGLIVRLPRHPALLLPHLAERGLQVALAPLPESPGVLLLVQREDSLDV